MSYRCDLEAQTVRKALVEAPPVPNCLPAKPWGLLQGHQCVL